MYPTRYAALKERPNALVRRAKNGSGYYAFNSWYSYEFAKDAGWVR